MAYRKTAFLVTALACAAPSTAADDPSRCYAIRDPDRRAACLAETRAAKSYCYSIRDRDRRELCLARTTSETARRYNLRDPDLCAGCLAGMGR